MGNSVTKAGSDGTEQQQDASLRMQGGQHPKEDNKGPETAF